jgi:redox-sensitive bicupin YhaK (pirin superfamily)
VSGQVAVFGAGDVLVVDASADAPEPLEVLLLGGKPIREPVVSYGPFVMNTKAEIVEAMDDFQAGKMGAIPPR